MKFKNVILTKQNAILFAISNYENPQCLGIKEFRDDYKLFKKLNNSINKEQVHLSLNYIITLNNIFTNGSSIKLMYYFLDDKNVITVNTILVFLHIIDNINIDIDEILLNQLKRI